MRILVVLALGALLLATAAPAEAAVRSAARPACSPIVPIDICGFLCSHGIVCVAGRRGLILSAH